MMYVVHRRTTLKRCAFTGYRPSKLPSGYDEQHPSCIALKDTLRSLIEDLIGRNYVHFLSGGSLGIDIFAAEAVLDLQRAYPWILLEMVIPFAAQADKWSYEYKARYNRLLGAAEIITNTGYEYAKGAMFKRNRYLVDNADLLIAVYDGQPGGTDYTVRYAKECRREMVFINPTTLAVTRESPTQKSFSA